MIDIFQAVLDAVSQPEVTALTGDRIWEGPDLPEGYSPLEGPAIVFVLRTGPIEYHRRLVRPSYFVRMYGASESECSNLWRRCVDVWPSVRNGQSRIQLDRSNGVLRIDREPTTGWRFAVSTWNFSIRT